MLVLEDPAAQVQEGPENKVIMLSAVHSFSPFSTEKKKKNQTTEKTKPKPGC